MQTQEKVEDALIAMEYKPTYSGMSYKEGVEDALRWMIGDIDDDEFFPFDGG